MLRALDIQGFSGLFTITAELLYQSVSYQFTQDLFQDSHSLTTLFDSLYKEADKLPTLMQSHRVDCPLKTARLRSLFMAEKGYNKPGKSDVLLRLWLKPGSQADGRALPRMPPMVQR
jgi:hypothetical protein